MGEAGKWPAWEPGTLWEWPWHPLDTISHTRWPSNSSAHTLTQQPSPSTAHSTKLTRKQRQDSEFCFIFLWHNLHRDLSSCSHHWLPTRFFYLSFILKEQRQRHTDYSHLLIHSPSACSSSQGWAGQGWSHVKLVVTQGLKPSSPASWNVPQQDSDQLQSGVWKPGILTCAMGGPRGNFITTPRIH